MSKTQPKKHFQIRRLFGLAKDKAAAAGMDTKEYLEETRGQITRGRTRSLSTMSFEEANAFIERLGGQPFKRYSRRTENYRKQQAGIKTIETDAHIDFIRELANLRGMTLKGLEKLATRMNLSWPPLTTEQGNKLAEALKAMNKRDGLLSFKTPQSAIRNPQSKDPKFRRVA